MTGSLNIQTPYRSSDAIIQALITNRHYNKAKEFIFRLADVPKSFSSTTWNSLLIIIQQSSLETIASRRTVLQFLGRLIKRQMRPLQPLPAKFHILECVAASIATLLDRAIRFPDPEVPLFLESRELANELSALSSPYTRSELPVPRLCHAVIGMALYVSAKNQGEGVGRTTAIAQAIRVMRQAVGVKPPEMPKKTRHVSNRGKGHMTNPLDEDGRPLFQAPLMAVLASLHEMSGSNAEFLDVLEEARMKNPVPAVLALARRVLEGVDDTVDEEEEEDEVDSGDEGSVVSEQSITAETVDSDLSDGSRSGSEFSPG
ncbi:hypothetical protein J8273_6235 [Carpediemonas membranifera]|uniref:Uncharacterized protein n=1 Tax=Carpediemonas membranifera TaxID=201153 RepID=A0A8J6ASS9_9EUKA|nr:hypothetical protein J8273_6235 [Carpediemonas membranifera]|eukprot:KAG9391475.1 hypothetical protein J8273_6235 [Carpediemonas membranifera]